MYAQEFMAPHGPPSRPPCLSVGLQSLLPPASLPRRAHARHANRFRYAPQARKKEEEDQIRTAGVRYKESLLAVTADGEGDKVLLPPSALDSLSRQDAVSMGPMLFELTCTLPGKTGDKAASVRKTTHAGVLEFVADEGTIGLPRKVVLSLLGATAQQVPIPAESPMGDQGDGGENGLQKAARPVVAGLEHVVVRYVRLAKAKFARVVPETVGLSQVSELRAMLEHNMRNHATLTVGDRLTVWRRGKEFSLKVRLRADAGWMGMRICTVKLLMYLSDRVSECKVRRGGSFSPGEKREDAPSACCFVCHLGAVNCSAAFLHTRRGATRSAVLVSCLHGDGCVSFKM